MICSYRHSGGDENKAKCDSIPTSCRAISSTATIGTDAKYRNLAQISPAGVQPSVSSLKCSIRIACSFAASHRVLNQVRPKDTNNKWYAVTDKEAGCEELPADSICPSRILSSYMKDGISCDEQDQSNPLQPEPYFAKNKIFGTDYLCRMSPRPEGRGGCTRCNGVGCCNQRGTFGARIASTECITLRWLSDSSLACRLAPGIGSGLDVMVAIDDYAGSALSVGKRLFSFDVPMISSMTPGASPSTVCMQTSLCKNRDVYAKLCFIHKRVLCSGRKVVRDSWTRFRNVRLQLGWTLFI